MPPRPHVGEPQVPLTFPCAPYNHYLCSPTQIITLNLTLAFAASWLGHTSHVGHRAGGTSLGFITLFSV